MQLITLIRNDRQPERTFGIFEYDRTSIFSLEDTDRNLKSDMPLAGIKEIKVYGKTAIPYGRYEVVINYSNRFKKRMPLLLNVPGFSGIRIHNGLHEGHTDGCPLIALSRDEDSLINSKAAFDPFFLWLDETLKTEKVFIDVVKG